MKQLNIGLDQADKARFDAIAAAEGVPSATLGRSVLLEFLAASDEGRAMFEPSKPPVDPDLAVTLVSKLDRFSIEHDRILRSFDRREHKMLKAFNATEEANRNAVERLGEELSTRFSEGATPFAEMLSEHLEVVGRLRKDILAAARSPEWIADINTKLDAIEAAANEPRNLNQYEIAPNWRLPAWQLCLAALVALLAAALVITMLARLAPDSWIATPMSRAMFGSADEAMCELWKDKNDFDACPILVPMTEEPTQ